MYGHAVAGIGHGVQTDNVHGSGSQIRQGDTILCGIGRMRGCKNHSKTFCNCKHLFVIVKVIMVYLFVIVNVIMVELFVIVNIILTI